MSRIIAFAGSTREASYNKLLVNAAASMATKAGGDVTLLDLRDYPMPIYDGDLEDEHGPPENATKLYELMKEHQGLLISCPEYNSSITPVLKNTIDWISRPRDGEPSLAAFSSKVAGLLSASPGGLGGLRGLTHAREILSNIGVIVLPQQVAVSNAFGAFNSDGELVDASLSKRVENLTAELVNMTGRLSE